MYFPHVFILSFIRIFKGKKDLKCRQKICKKKRFTFSETRQVPKMWVNYFSSPFKTSQGVCNKVRSIFFASCAKLIETICLTGKRELRTMQNAGIWVARNESFLSISHTIEINTFREVHSVWKSLKKSHPTFRTVDENSLKKSHFTTFSCPLWLANCLKITKKMSHLNYGIFQQFLYK